MEAAEILQYRYTGLAQEIVCASDAISGIRQSLDRLGVSRALVVCGPTILEKSNVVQRVQQALGDYAAGLFPEVAPHSPIEVVDRAVDAGAMAANYLEATSLLKRGDRICGARLTDLETGSEIEVEADVVINATGAFVQRNPKASKENVGFHWNALCAMSWGQLAELYLRAKTAARASSMARTS